MDRQPVSPTLFNFIQRRMEHERFMDNAHATWEMLYGTPCGPYNPRRAGRPMGIRTTEAADS